MLQTRMVAFSVTKGGNAAHEWEDGAMGDVGDPSLGRSPRFVVADGATEAYDSLRWVDQLVTSFIDPTSRAPALDSVSMHRWFTKMQLAWVQGAPRPFANIIEEHKFSQGSFATFLGCELNGIDGPSPVWTATALGDTVLFHVRRGRLVEHFPALSSEDFGLNPDGVHTAPEALPGMMRQLQFRESTVLLGDRLFLATDALAHWIVRANARDSQGQLWSLLCQLSHPDTFEQFVIDRRAAGEMKNDDVTLVRVHIVDACPDYVLVCR